MSEATASAIAGHWAASALPPDVESRLQQIERMVGEAKNVPLSSSIMLNRADVEAVIAELRAVLPEELRQARWVVKERDEVLDKARRDASKMVGEAQDERARLVAKTEVVQAANREADRIIEEAKEHSRQLRLEAEDYVDAKLANFEVVLHKTLAAVARGREKLRGRLDSDELSEGEDYDDEPYATA